VKEFRATNKIVQICLFFVNIDTVAACNRTYYGDVGRTYELEIHGPRDDHVPYVCHLTFQAGGGDLGDLIKVQPTFYRDINLCL
jgi:hypothetical protein